MLRGDGVRKRGGKWRVRWVDAHGARREAVIEAKSRTEAREKRAKLVSRASENRLGIWDGDADATFNDVWKDYEPLAKRLANWRTIEGYWRLHIQPELGNKRLRQVSRNDLRRFLAAKSAQLEPRSCEHVRIRIGALFRFAAEEGVYRGENIASAIGPIPVPEKSPRTLDVALVQELIDAVESRWRNFFALAVYTGLRSGELRALTRESLDPNRVGLTVSRSGGRSTTKTGRSRFVALPAAALPYVEAALKESAGRPWLFVDTRGKQLSRNIKCPEILRAALDRLGLVASYTLWCKNRGCRYRARGLATADAKTCPKCEVWTLSVLPESPYVFHDLRKTWESHMMSLGDPLSVARMAGHSLDVANRHYLAADQRRLVAVANQLDFKRLAPSWPPTDLETTENNRTGLDSAGRKQAQPEGN